MFILLIREEVIRVAIDQVVGSLKNNDEQEIRIKVERLSNNVLALSVHETQLLRVLTSFQAKGVEPYRCINNDTRTGEYELLYIASENPEADTIRIQHILDAA